MYLVFTIVEYRTNIGASRLYFIQFYYIHYYNTAVAVLVIGALGVLNKL